MDKSEIIKSKIRSIPDFPKKGIIFRDITTLIQDAEGLSLVIDSLVEEYKDAAIDKIAGVEARGFIIAGALAHRLGKGFIPVRKKGKLPYNTVSYEYELEYGTDSLEIHVDSIDEGDNVLLIDDLLATGGTSLAAAELIRKVGGNVSGMGFIVNLPDVGGEKKLRDAGYDIFTLCEFEGD